MLHCFGFSVWGSQIRWSCLVSAMVGGETSSDEEGMVVGSCNGRQRRGYNVHNPRSIDRPDDRCFFFLCPLLRGMDRLCAYETGMGGRPARLERAFANPHTRGRVIKVTVKNMWKTEFRCCRIFANRSTFHSHCCRLPTPSGCHLRHPLGGKRECFLSLACTLSPFALPLPHFDCRLPSCMSCEISC